MNLLFTFAELDKLYESADLKESNNWLDRETLISKIKDSGKQYDFDKYSDAQLYKIWERIQDDENKDLDFPIEDDLAYCEACGQHLTDGGFCPKCDDGAEDLDESTALSTVHANVSVVDQIKAVHEAGLLNRLPVGRENALTVDIYGPDKGRLVGYFKRQPEFNYEMNDEAGVISHEFISDKYDIEIFDEFVSMYKIPQNESVKGTTSDVHTINENINKETNKMNFQTILEELNSLYEEKAKKADLVVEDAEEEILIDDEPIIDDEAIEETEGADETEAPATDVEEPVIDTQLVLECANCGGLVIKQDADVAVDESTDLANVDEACQYCEETKGYRVIGTFAPYETVETEPEEAAEKKDEEAAANTDDESSEPEEIEEGILGKKNDAKTNNARRDFEQNVESITNGESLFDVAHNLTNLLNKSIEDFKYYETKQANHDIDNFTMFDKIFAPKGKQVLAIYTDLIKSLKKPNNFYQAASAIEAAAKKILGSYSSEGDTLDRIGQYREPLLKVNNLKLDKGIMQEQLKKFFATIVSELESTAAAIKKNPTAIFEALTASDSKESEETELEEILDLNIDAKDFAGTGNKVSVLSGILPEELEAEKNEENLEELLDINLDAKGFGGSGNDVSVL